LHIRLERLIQRLYSKEGPPAGQEPPVGKDENVKDLANKPAAAAEGETPTG
jgi:hypothetical protein